MILLRKTRQAFGHIPRTAGYALAQWLGDYHGGEPCLGGEMPCGSKRHERTLPNDGPWSVFVVVRDPAERLASLWARARELDPNYHGIPFAEWFRDVRPLKKGWAMTMAAFVDELLSPTVLRFENLDDDLRRHGFIGPPVHKLNYTKRKPFTGLFRDSCTAEHMRLIVKHYSDDFDRFGYSVPN